MRTERTGTPAADRLLGVLTALVLLAAGAALLEWHYRWVFSWPDRIGTTRIRNVVSSGWWPWVFALVGVLLGLWVLLALVRRVPRPHRSQSRPVAASDRGAVGVSTGSLARVAGERFEQLAPVHGVSAGYRRFGRTPTVALSAHLNEGAGAEEVVSAVERLDQEIASAVGDEGTRTRVLLSPPSPLGRLRAGGPDPVRVDESSASTR